MATTNPADLTGDGRVDVQDLLQAIASGQSHLLLDVIDNLGWESSTHNPPGSWDPVLWESLVSSGTQDEMVAYLSGFTGPSAVGADLETVGSITTRRDGEVIEGKRVEGNIRVRHADVVIRDCVVGVKSNGRRKNGALYGIDDPYRSSIGGYSPNTTVQRCRFFYDDQPVDGGYTYRGALTGHTTFMDCVFEDCLWGIQASSRSVLKRCIVKPGPNPEGWHSAGLIVHDARHGLLVEDCAFLHGTTSAVQMSPYHAPIIGFTMLRSLLNSGGRYEYQGGYTPTDSKPGTDHWMHSRDHRIEGCAMGPSASGMFHGGEVVPGTIWKNNRDLGRVA